MLTTTGLIYVGGLTAITFVSRIWAKYKLERRAINESSLPLFDLVQLEIAMTPQPGDDPSILAEIRETLTHLNRRAFELDIWTLDEQLVTYHQRLPDPLRPTMHRAMLRLIQSQDRWLQLVGAKTSASLGLCDNLPAIELLLGRSVEISGEPETHRFQVAIEASVSKLR